MTNNEAIAFLEANAGSAIAADLIHKQIRLNRLNVRSFGFGSARLTWFKGFGMYNLTFKVRGSAVIKLAVKA